MNSNALDLLRQYKEEQETTLAQIEKKIADVEMSYLQAEHSQPGNVLKGFDGYLSSKDNLRKKARSFKMDDRMFSLSSSTSPVTQELQAEAMEAIDSFAAGTFGGKSKSYAYKGYGQKGYAQKGKR